MSEHAARVTACAIACSIALSLLVAGAASAGATAGDPAFSHRGIKGTLSFGTLHESSRLDLDDAPLIGLGVGYGFDERVSLWLGLTGSEHRRGEDGAARTRKTAAASMDLALQYRFLAADRVQPYLKAGLNACSLEETDTHNARVGTGVLLGAGADYFFAPHFGIGAEVTYRSVEYTRERIGRKGDFKEMARHLDGNATGLSISFTVQ